MAVATSYNENQDIMNLLLTGCFEYSKEQIETLCSLGYNIFFMQMEKDELPLDPSLIDALVCNGLFLYHDIDVFTSLKLIQLTSAGLDRVPVNKIKARGITLYNARGVYSVPMAEWVMFRVLEHYKQGWFFKQKQEGGRWTKHRELKEVAGKRIAIVGAGNVGQEVAKLFQAFGAETTGFDIHTNGTPNFDNMALTDMLRERVGEFDVVVVTAPSLPSTRGLISPDVLKSMKSGAVLVNISRGELIDEHGICEVLAKRKDLFAALDVFETEPLAANSPLWKLENVAVSPHNSFVSDGNNVRMFGVMYNNLKTLISKEE